MKALIVDDNKKNRDVLVMLLARESAQFVQLENPTQLGDVLDDEFDVVFLDLEMPQINGFDALQTLKNHPNFQNVPVVAYTVHLSEIGAVRDVGFDGFLGKPLDPDRFPDQLARILRGEQVWYTV